MSASTTSEDRAKVAEEALAKEKAENDRVMDILVNLLGPDWNTPTKGEEDGKDIASLVADSVRRMTARVAVMDKRIEADPVYQQKVGALDALHARMPEWAERWLPVSHRQRELAAEAKRALDDVRAARAAGFPLGEMENRILKLIGAEKAAERR